MGGFFFSYHVKIIFVKIKFYTITSPISLLNMDVWCISRFRCCLEVFVLTTRLFPSLSSERNHPKRPDGGPGQRSDAGRRSDAELTGNRHAALQRGDARPPAISPHVSASVLLPTATGISASGCCVCFGVLFVFFSFSSSSSD